MRYLLAGIEAASELQARTSVSLNKSKRLAERERLRQAQLDRENERRRATGLPLIDNIEKLKPEDLPDVLLEQTAEVLTDYIALGDAAASTANATPPRQPAGN